MYQATDKTPVPPTDPNSANTVDYQYQLYQQQQQQRYQTRQSLSHQASSFFQPNPPNPTPQPQEPSRSYANSTPYTVYQTSPPRQSAFSRYMMRLWRALLLVGLSVVSMFCSIGMIAFLLIATSLSGGWISLLFSIFFVLNILICFIGPLSKLDAYLSRQRQALHEAILAESGDIFGDCGA